MLTNIPIYVILITCRELTNWLEYCTTMVSGSFFKTIAGLMDGIHQESEKKEKEELITELEKMVAELKDNQRMQAVTLLTDCLSYSALAFIIFTSFYILTIKY